MRDHVGKAPTGKQIFLHQHIVAVHTQAVAHAKHRGGTGKDAIPPLLCSLEMSHKLGYASPESAAGIGIALTGRSVEITTRPPHLQPGLLRPLPDAELRRRRT